MDYDNLYIYAYLYVSINPSNSPKKKKKMRRKTYPQLLHTEFEQIDEVFIELSKYRSEISSADCDETKF